jgi:arylsulfatase A-like enzyme
MDRIILAISVMFSAVGFSDAQSEERTPNFIVILADDLGYGDLACYGADDVATPHIDRVIDGKDIWPVLADADGAKSPHEAIYFLRGRSVTGVRMGDWKYLVTSAKENSPEVEIELSEEEKKLPRRQRKALVKERTKAAPRTQGDIEMLYNLRDDVGEEINLVEQRPDIATRLKQQIETFSAELKKTLRPAATAEKLP